MLEAGQRQMCGAKSLTQIDTSTTQNSSWTCTATCVHSWVQGPPAQSSSKTGRPAEESREDCREIGSETVQNTLLLHERTPIRDRHHKMHSIHMDHISTLAANYARKHNYTWERQRRPRRRRRKMPPARIKNRRLGRRVWAWKAKESRSVNSSTKCSSIWLTEWSRSGREDTPSTLSSSQIRWSMKTKTPRRGRRCPCPSGGRRSLLPRRNLPRLVSRSCRRGQRLLQYSFGGRKKTNQCRAFRRLYMNRKAARSSLLCSPYSQPAGSGRLHRSCQLSASRWLLCTKGNGHVVGGQTSYTRHSFYFLTCHLRSRRHPQPASELPLLLLLTLLLLLRLFSKCHRIGGENSGNGGGCGWGSESLRCQNRSDLSRVSL